MHVASLHIFPVKGCHRVDVSEARTEERGFEGDRRFVIVDEKSVFLSQRSVPALALVRPALTSSGLVLSAPGMPDLIVPTEADGSVVTVSIWGDEVAGESSGGEAAGWLSTFLRVPCRLVRMTGVSTRQISRKTVPQGGEVSFADAYPYLVATHSSLDDLNRRLTSPVPMDRFRPNIVIEGSQPFEEDAWRSIRIGSVLFDCVKPCARCTVITVDQESGVAGNEPLKTLAGFRRKGNEVLFGQNAIARAWGTVRVGDSVEILSRSDTL